MEEQPEPTEDPATPSSPEVVEVASSLPPPEVMAVELPTNSESTIGRDSHALPLVRIGEVTEPGTLQGARRDSSPPHDDGRRELPPRRTADPYGVTSTAVRTRRSLVGNLTPIPTDPIRDPPSHACFNCWRKGHNRARCSLPAAIFCYNCGWPGTDRRDCLRCSEEYQ